MPWPEFAIINPACDEAACIGAVTRSVSRHRGSGRLCDRPWSDLGPLRMISRLFERIAPQEMTFGWTIEAQIAAARLPAAIYEIPVHERRRIAGQQKVSGVTWHRTLSIGCQIIAGGHRTRPNFRPTPTSRRPALTRPESSR